MFKIDKSTHLLILFTFAIVFVVVYLYYTIIDVRKMQKELKTLSEDVLALKKYQAQENQASLHEEEHKVVPVVVATETSDESEEELFDVAEFRKADTESVHSEEVQALLDPNDNTSSEISEPLPPSLEEEPSTSEEPKPEQEAIDLNTLRYDELRDLCKKLNINQRGTKEVLIKRLIEHQS